MPNRPNFSRTALSTLAAASLVLGWGCSLYKARKAYDAGSFEESARAYHDIIVKDPKNLEAQIGYKRASLRASEAHLDQAREAQNRGQLDVVEREVRKAYRLDPSNSRAQEWIARIEMAAQKRRSQDESLEDQRDRAESKSAILLNPRSLEGMDLNFSRKTSLKDIFSALSKNSGISIILHSSFQDSQISADLRGLTFQRILDTLMLQSDLFYKVIDTNTIMVFKNTNQNRLDFENQLIKTFYLSNADINDVRQVFTTLMPQVRVVVDKRMNALTVKARPVDLTIASRIVNQLDKAKAEVMVYMELMEVTESNLEKVGLVPVAGPGDTSGVYRIGAMLKTQQSAGDSSLNTSDGGISFKKSDVRFLFPSLALDALQSNGDAKLVASPNVRVISGEKADVKIGEKVSTTQTSYSIPSSTSGTSTSSIPSGALGSQYSYEDVGVTISVEPRVHFNDDITITLKAKVTTQKASSTPGRPDLGQREINTVCRMRDGETAVFGGLLKEDEQKSLQGIWGLTDIPVLGRLLGNNYKSKAKTDVILTVRAVLVRKPDLSETDFEAFDPDLATSQGGPFSVKKDQPKSEGQNQPIPQRPVAPPPAPVQPQAQTANPAHVPPASYGQPAHPPVTSGTTSAPTSVAPTSAPGSSNPAAGSNLPPAAAAAAASQPMDDAQDLVLFFTPLNSSIKVGERQFLTLMASGGKGLSNGSIDLRIDPRLKVISVNPGDFLTTEGGGVEQSMGKNNVATLKFRRATAGSDSGALAIIEVEALKTGNAPILVQSDSSRFMVGSNPIPAKVVNALISVE